MQALWPGTQVTIGPVIENGFYYDFFRNEPFTPEDFAAIEKKMREIIARDKPFTKEVWSRDQAKRVFRDKGEALQGRAGRRHPGGPADQDLQAGRLVRSLPRPAHDLDRQGRQRLQADEGRAAPIGAAIQQPRDARRASTARPSPSRKTSTPISSRSRKPRSATIARLGREMDLFHFQEEAPGSVFWHPKGWTLFQLLENYIRRRQTDAGYVEVNSPQLMDKALWETSGHMATYPRHHVPDASRATRTSASIAVKPMNCPGHVQIFKNGLEVLPRPAAEDRRVRQGAPLRAVGRAARADARARLHPGRRPRVHHRGADRRGSR